jgi:exodeoxyribonuclease VII large subunit
VVAIIRGGGGDIGLTCYNNFDLAKAIALYPLPVITGIGHSTNETVSEMVAYKNAITPTELADFLLQRYHEFTIPLQEAENTLIEKTKRLIREQRSALFNVARYLRSVTKGMISNYKNELAYTSKSLVKNADNSVLQQVVAIRHLRKQVSASTLNLINLNYQILTDKNNKLSDNTRNLFRNHNKEVLNIEKIVNIMSPIHVLKRGYSITTVNGTLLKNINEIKKGDKIVTLLTDGSINSTITSSKKSTDNE